MGGEIIEVRMLGQFSVSCGDAELSDRNNRSRKTRILLAYLICNRKRMVAIDELICVLGGSQKNTAPIAALRTALYRLRRDLEPLQEQSGLPLIISRNGMYGWNPAAAVELDTAKFEALCQEEVPEGPEQLDLYRRTLELYQGDLLCALSAEQWVEPLAEYYRNLYISAAERAAPAFIDAGLAREAVACCVDAIRRAPYHETLYRHLICAYAALGDKESARAAYEDLRSALYEDLGVMPGEDVQQAYEDLLLGAEEDVVSLDSVRVQLQECGPVSGALICDYSFFKLLYQAEARAAARRGDTIHIGILSVARRDKAALTPRRLAHVMEQLREQIKGSLRTGDIASRCSPSQYILMLVQANYENSKQVCNRVIQAFYSAYPRSPVRIQPVVFPLEPRTEDRNIAQK